MNMKFWKKEDDPFADLGADFSTDFETPQTDFTPQPTPDFPGLNPESPPPGTSFVPQDQPKESNNLQYDVIIARLDGIKAQLDVLTHRLEQLEKLQKSPKEATRGPWYTK